MPTQADGAARSISEPVAPYGTFHTRPDRSPAEAPGTTVGFSSSRKEFGISSGRAIWLGHRKGRLKFLSILAVCDRERIEPLSAARAEVLRYVRDLVRRPSPREATVVAFERCAYSSSENPACAGEGGRQGPGAHAVTERARRALMSPSLRVAGAEGKTEP